MTQSCLPRRKKLALIKKNKLENTFSWNEIYSSKISEIFNHQKRSTHWTRKYSLSTQEILYYRKYQKNTIIKGELHFWTIRNTLSSKEHYLSDHRQEYSNRRFTLLNTLRKTPNINHQKSFTLPPILRGNTLSSSSKELYTSSDFARKYSIIINKRALHFLRFEEIL